MIEAAAHHKVVLKYDHRVSDELYTFVAENYLKIDKYKFLIELRTTGVFNFEAKNLSSLATTLDQIDKFFSIFKLSLDYQLNA